MHRHHHHPLRSPPRRPPLLHWRSHARFPRACMLVITFMRQITVASSLCTRGGTPCGGVAAVVARGQTSSQVPKGPVNGAVRSAHGAAL